MAEQAQVLQSVVRFIAADVMHDLVGRQLTAYLIPKHDTRPEIVVFRRPAADEPSTIPTLGPDDFRNAPARLSTLSHRATRSPVRSLRGRAAYRVLCAPAMPTQPS